MREQVQAAHLVIGDLNVPEPAASGVAAAAVDQDEQLGGLGVTSPPLGPPPVHQGVHGELRRVVGGAEQHRAPVGLHIIEAARKGDAAGQGREIVVVNRQRGGRRNAWQRSPFQRSCCLLWRIPFAAWAPFSRSNRSDSWRFAHVIKELPRLDASALRKNDSRQQAAPLN